ncbi:MAG: hypothetical protein ACXU9U_03195 [Parachlamydiaceae bacterium]
MEIQNSLFQFHLSGLDAHGYHFWQTCENYISLFSPVDYKVEKIVEKCINVIEVKQESNTRQWTTIVKIISLATIILPLFAIAYCTYCRSFFNFREVLPFVSKESFIDSIAQALSILSTQKFDSLNSPEKMTNFFYAKINRKIDSDKDRPFHHLHVEIPRFFAAYFDLDDEIIRDVIFDKAFQIKLEVVAACLEFAEVVTITKDQNSHLLKLKEQLKAKLKDQYKIDEKDETSFISLSKWTDIDLENILILSHRRFYHIQQGTDDLRWLVKQFHQELKPPYTARDAEKFRRKCCYLQLDVEKPSLKTENVAVGVDEEPLSWRFRSLENLIEELANTEANADLGNILIPYLDTLNSPSVQQLLVPDLDLPLSAINMYQVNIHIYAIYLWNALKAAGHVPRECPEQLILYAQNYHLELNLA